VGAAAAAPSASQLPDARLQEMFEITKAASEALANAPLDDEVAEARWTVAATSHPASGDAIPPPFRIAAWPFMGSVPCTALAFGARYYPGNLAASSFWQWWNQSQNAGTGYFNGAAASGGADAVSTFAKGYGVAVSVAMVLALGAGAAVKRHGAALGPLARFLPFPAVAAANVCNTVAVRWHEVEQGIEVSDSNGVVLGESVIAAKQALYDTCITRIVLPAGNFVVAPLVIIPFDKLVLPKHPRLKLPVYFGVTLSVFLSWIPVSLALYPQLAEMEVDELEPEIAAKTAESKVFYNKGL